MGTHHHHPGNRNSPQALSCCSAESQTTPGSQSSMNGQIASGSIGGSGSGDSPSGYLQTASANTSSSSTSSVCGLTSPYESRLISSTYPRLSGLYGSSPYTDQTNYMNPFETGHASFYPTLV